MGKMKPFHFLAKNCSTTRGPITQHLNQNSRANASDFTRSPISINEYGCQSIIPKFLMMLIAPSVQLLTMLIASLATLWKELYPNSRPSQQQV